MNESREINIPILQKESRRNILFTIGINKYKYVSRLKNAVKDVEDFTEILTNLYQFDTEDVITLHDELATENNIRAKFKELIKELTPQDNIILYFSGHGHFDKVEELGYWIPVDGKEDTPSTYVSNNDIAHYLRKFKAHHVFLIIDSCFSGSMLEQFRSTNIPGEEFPSRKIFTSGKSPQVVMDGIPGENSPFATGIFNLLRHTKERYISTTTLIQKVKEYMADAVTKDYIRPQQPDDGTITQSIHNGGQFYFLKKLTEEEFWSNVKSKNTQEDYEGYLELFPQGYYIVHAYDKVRELKAIKAWHDAVADHTLFGYKNYIKNYPNSPYLLEAKNRLKKLIDARDQIIMINKKEAEEREKKDIYQKKYKTLYREAEKFFRKENYKEARKKYYESLLYYQEDSGFFPNKSMIEDRINKSNDFILFEEYTTDAMWNYKNRSFETALKFFMKAIEVNPKDNIVNEYIGYTRDRINNPLPVIQVVSRASNSTDKITITPQRKQVTIVKKKESGFSNLTIHTSNPKDRIEIRSSQHPKITVPLPVHARSNVSRPKYLVTPKQKKQNPTKTKYRTKLWIALIVLIYLLACKLTNVF